ncbi:SRPBCC family protein [Streptomyces sp. NPDC050428]|uniref:SRPBCC family protein n=1 Tax=Streptomyces sp. NPDC050428 TaxID=3155757 RepID=UPI00344522FF
MEHEVFIPVPAETLREALRDHARVARCVPGLQQDADASARPLSGRLKVRVGGHTITYRGALTLTERAGGFTAKGEGAEVRGPGSVKVNVRVRLTETAGGTTVAFTATTTPTPNGRLSDVAATTSESTARRLLDRFAAALAKPVGAAGPGHDPSPAGPPNGGAAESSGSNPAAGGGPSSGRDESGPDVRSGDRDVTASEAAPGTDAGGPDADEELGAAGGGAGRDRDVTASDAAAGDGAGDSPAGDAAAGGGPSSGPDSSRPDARSGDQDVTASDAAPGDGPSESPRADRASGRGPDDARSDRDGTASDADRASDSPGADSDDSPDADPDTVSDSDDLPEPPPSELDASVEFGVTSSGDGDFLVPLEPPAEAAHARRTMIGRSAEEVDHAPPRGRYAPEQAPDTGGAGAALRWVAPAAALAIAGAVVVGRALRRRR